MSDWPIVSDNPEVQAHYEHCRAEGTAHLLAEMFAFQKPPRSNSDVEFLSSRGGCYAQFSEDDIGGKFYREEAIKAGVNPHGKVYMPSLATRPGDPEAWVSGRGDVKRVCEKRGWGVQGAGMNVPVVNTVEPKDPRKYEPAADLVENRAEQLQVVNPELKGEALTEKAKESLKPCWSK